FAAFQQRRHLIPGLIHAAAIDALNRQPFENDVFGKIQGDGLRGQAKKGNPASAAHNVESSSNGGGMAGHLEHDINSESPSRLHDELGYVLVGRVEHKVCLHLLRDSTTVLVDLDGEDGRSTHCPRYRNREQADRTTSRDGDCFGSDLAGKHGVDGIAQRVQDRRVFLRNGGIEFPDVALGNTNVFSKGAVGIDTDNLDELTYMSLAGAALQTLSARHMHLGGHKVAFFYARNFVSIGNHLTAKLVPVN